MADQKVYSMVELTVGQRADLMAALLVALLVVERVDHWVVQTVVR